MKGEKSTMANQGTSTYFLRSSKNIATQVSIDSDVDMDTDVDELIDGLSNLLIDKPITCIYARVSSNGQASLADQIVLAEDYIKKNNLPTDLRIFTDVGSGRELNRLTNHTEMLNTLLSTPGNHLILYDMSRLGRSMEVFKLLDMMMEAKVTIHSLQECIAISKDAPYSIIAAQRLVCAAIEFSQNLSKRIKTSFATKKRRGVFVGKTCPFGFYLHAVKSHNVTENFLRRDVTFNAAKKLAKTKQRYVNRPDDMTFAQLKQHRRKFNTYVRMSARAEATISAM